MPVTLKAIVSVLLVAGAKLLTVFVPTVMVEVPDTNWAETVNVSLAPPLLETVIVTVTLLSGGRTTFNGDAVTAVTATSCTVGALTVKRKVVVSPPSAVLSSGVPLMVMV